MDLKIYNRSGLASKNGISIRNKVGVIDNLYRGECMGFFQNEDRVPYTINPGDRVAQMVVERRLDVNIVTIDELSDTDRGDRGFGSTGKN
jgi:dUTP pyrophosphatase